MKTAKLTVILLAAALILLAVPQVRGTLDLLLYSPNVAGRLRKAEVEQAVQQYPQDPELWLAFAECGANSDFPQRYWSPTYPWDQSWSPTEAYQRAISSDSNSCNLWRHLSLTGGRELMSSWTKTIRHPKGRVYLSNNPQWSDRLYTPLKDEEWELNGFPWLWVTWRDLPCGGEWDIAVTVFGREEDEMVSFTSQQAESNGSIHWQIRLDAPIPEAWVAHTVARQGREKWEQWIELRTFTLSGRITDFEGNPRIGFLHAGSGMTVCTDEAGNYSLSLPDCPISAIFVGDWEYGKTTAECWIYDYHPMRDLVLDCHIGDLELYELHAWRSFTGIRANFVCMSVHMARTAIAHRGGPRGLVGPELAASNIRVELDGTRADVLSMHSRSVALSRQLRDRQPGATSTTSLEHILQIAYPQRDEDPGHPQVLRVIAEKQMSLDGQTWLGRGEAYHLGLIAGTSVSGGSWAPE